MHGLFDNGQSWVMSGTREDHGKALPYQVVDAGGFDVWIMNWRGTLPSRHHEYISPDTQRAYWQFSFEEFGEMDLRACIDFINKESDGDQKISLVAYSEGTTSSFFASAEDPEYFEKNLNIMVAMAPVIYLKHAGNPLLRKIAGESMIFDFLDKHSFLEIYGKNTNKHELVKYIKDKDSWLCQMSAGLQDYCQNEEHNSGLLHRSLNPEDMSLINAERYKYI